MTIEIDAAGLARAAERERPLVLDVYDDACTACVTQERHLDALTVAVGDGAEVARLNVTGAPDLAARLGVSALPTVIVYKDGRARRRFPGLTDPGALAAAVRDLR